MGNTESQGVVSDDVMKRRAIAKMDSEMRSKMNRGVNYNSILFDFVIANFLTFYYNYFDFLYLVRIVIRGETMTGKTCLWHRLQGHPYQEPEPTTNIQVCTIPWNYKGSFLKRDK